VLAGPSRGGPTTLVLNADSSVYYSTGINCGFGSRMSGTWSFHADSIVLNLLLVEPYTHYPDFDDRPQKLTFKVGSLTRYGLILIDNSGIEKLFCKI
jgi:hypothetical protein